MLTKTIGRIGAVSAAVLMAAAALPAGASSHREAPAITKTPKVDGTDFYMFRSYEPGREGFVTFIANYQPLQGPYYGPNYFTMDSDAIYEIHVDSNGDAAEDLTFQFQFNSVLVNNTGITLNVGGVAQPIPLRAVGQITSAADADLGEPETYTVNVIRGDRRTGTRQSVTNTGGGAVFPKPIDYIGTKTFPDYATYANAFVTAINIPGCTGVGRVFAGQRAEAFAVNLGESFDLVNYVPIEGDSAPGAGDRRGFPGGITQSRANDDLVGKLNVTSLAIEVPISCLTPGGNGVIGGWTTASLPQAMLRDPTPTYADPTIEGGSFVQVSRLSHPLVNELVIGMPQKDLFNAAEPTGDAALASYVTNPTFPAILNALFRGPVNATLGTNIADLAPSNFPRSDLVATFLTGINTLNQQQTVRGAEIMRLNTGVAPTPRDRQSPFGVVGDDLAGYPNGRRPGDDTVDITLRVAMGRLCHPVPINGTQTSLGLCQPSSAPVGTVPFTDGAPYSARELGSVFPYLNTPIPGSSRAARNARTN